MSRTTRLILLGGFLGAGKTTLMAQAAGVLLRRGKRVGLITNDQAAGLVDTEIAKHASGHVREVAGGCFCCKFSDLVKSIEELLAEFAPDVVIAEPVGSCTDLSATVVQPMKDRYSAVVSMPPYSVIVDPFRLSEALDADAPGLFPESVRYIYRKQIEEADLIVLNKTDLLSADQLEAALGRIAAHFPGIPLIAVSALRPGDAERWIDHVLQGGISGERIAEVDYDTYAEGEAQLGWLNATVHVRPETRVDWKAFVLDLMERLHGALAERSAEIAHLKLVLEGGGAEIAANLTSLADRPTVRGGIPAEADALTLILNARVHLDPIELQRIVESCLAEAAGNVVHADVSRIESFRPARPRPTHRYGRVV